MNPAAIWYFECVNLYNILCPHKVKAMAHRHVFKKYKKGELVYAASDRPTHIYLIADGRVRVGHYLADGQEVTKSILVRGEIFGELMYGDRELNFKILKLIGLRLMKVERKLELLVFKDARTRVVEFLKDAAVSVGQKAGYDTIVHTRLTHKDIATLTGTSRQTVTTILNDLQEKKFLSFDRRRILIHDVDGLC
jgi:CRP/FNR family transcriptional regulator, cyclic AMP receptor protein